MEEMEVRQISKGVESTTVAFDFEHTPITQIADYIIITAAKSNASDIHFDPRENGMMVRFRIDGDLQDYTFIPKVNERNLVTRLKLLANMNITESRLPQDGAIKGEFGGMYLDMRVSCLPLNEGEKIVIRILDYSRSLQGIETLGFNKTNLAKIKRMMKTPNGIILVTGATGSGKSTTVYSILQGLNKPELNIITVEDPIEMNIQGMNQVQVNAEIGMTFAAALRSILRQDPNIILIGEIRDSETAQIAVRASITGHLVLSTIHTNNSLATIERLLDMDVERYLLSTSLTGIISQRLAKQLCPYCRVERETTPYEKRVFKKYMNLDVPKIYDANEKGCKYCRKGYKGRIAIHEVLEFDDEIRSALANTKLKKDDLSKMVYNGKTISMLQDALGKAIAGITSFEEVYRVIEIESTPEDGDISYLTRSLDDVEDQNTKGPDENINLALSASLALENAAPKEIAPNQQVQQSQPSQTAQPTQPVTATPQVITPPKGNENKQEPNIPVIPKTAPSKIKTPTPQSSETKVTPQEEVPPAVAQEVKLPSQIQAEREALFQKKQEEEKRAAEAELLKKKQAMEKAIPELNVQKAVPNTLPQAITNAPLIQNNDNTFTDKDKVSSPTLNDLTKAKDLKTQTTVIANPLIPTIAKDDLQEKTETPKTNVTAPPVEGTANDPALAPKTIVPPLIPQELVPTEENAIENKAVVTKTPIPKEEKITPVTGNITPPPKEEMKVIESGTIEKLKEKRKKEQAEKKSPKKTTILDMKAFDD